MAEKGTSRVSLRDTLFVVFSKKHVFISIFIAIVVVTNAIAWLYPKVYEVSATILIKPTVESSLQYDVPPRALQSDPVTPEMINSEIGIILSQELLRKVVIALDLADVREPDNILGWVIYKIKSAKRYIWIKLGLSHESEPIDIAVNDLRDSLDVQPLTLSNLIQVSMAGHNPEEITQIVNTVADNYIDRHIEVHQSQAGSKFFNKQSEVSLKKLTDAEAALRDFQKKWNIINIDAQRNGNLLMLTNLRERLSQINTRIAELQTTYNLTQKDMEAMTEANTSNIVLAEMNRSMLPLLVERERIASLYPKSSAEFKDIDIQVKELNNRIKQEMNRILAGNKIDLSALIAQQETVQKAIKHIEDESMMLTQKETELNRLKRELAQSEKAYLLYDDKAEEARIETQKEVARVSNVAVTSWAHRPVAPVFPKKFLMGVLALIMGLVMGVAGAFFTYYLDHTVKTPEDLPRYAGIAIMSSVGLVEKK